MEFKFKVDDESNCDLFYNSIILPDNNTITIEFIENISKKSVHYFINLYIKHKRNQNVKLKQIGKCGIQSLVWAKNQIIEFEKFIVEHKPYEKYDKNVKKIYISTFADDSQRYRVYKFGLTKIGFIETKLYNAKCLTKLIIENR